MQCLYTLNNRKRSNDPSQLTKNSITFESLAQASLQFRTSLTLISLDCSSFGEKPTETTCARLTRHGVPGPPSRNRRAQQSLFEQLRDVVIPCLDIDGNGAPSLSQVSVSQCQSLYAAPRVAWLELAFTARRGFKHVPPQLVPILNRVS
jgi:hypothetical protein